jgi:mycothiol system anti-sigma-R factor
MKGEKDQADLGCREALHRVYHFLDGELTPERRDAIAHHLDECPPCGGAYGFESELRKVIANRCHDQVPDELRDRIAAALDHETEASGSTGSSGPGASSRA